jgi:16S rRNA (adenine1518-N6/adenine1519-N6)-dimethyltransferase
MSGFIHPATLLAEFGGRARKRFGQNFLAAEGVVRATVAAAEIGPKSRVVEVGPGLGVLTGALLETGAHVTAVELDRDLVAYLKGRFEAELTSGQLRLVSTDAAKVDWAELLPGEGWRLVANLPYNVGTRIATALLGMPQTVDRLVIMLQKEVGQRMMADAGSSARGSLSVFVEARADASLVRKVPPGCFFPPPKVHSVVLRLDVHPAPKTGDVDPSVLERLCRVGFAGPRKTVRKGLCAAYPAAEVDRALAVAEIQPSLRPNMLTLEEWLRLTATLTP